MLSRNSEVRVARTPEDTFTTGRELGSGLSAGDAVLLTGGLGAGKTLFTKGILDAFDFDTDEVTSPSFTLVNLYRTPTHAVYHIDLWRIGPGVDAATAVGLGEIIEEANSIVIIEWAERLGNVSFAGRTYRIIIEGDGDDPRTMHITTDACLQK